MAKMKQITKEELLNLARHNTIQEIADMLNTSYTTVWKYLKKAGYHRKVGRPSLFNIN
jgi:predicted transcriptional regulator YheO